jgi:broad specificity phosphatase PhoE
MKIHFTRHGESLANILGIISNHDLPHPLTEKGQEQARALATRLRGIPLVRIYASPVLRACETAEIVGAAINVPVEVSEALKEYDCGILEGRGDEAAWALLQQFARDWFEGRNRDSAPEGGESFFDIQKRLGNFVRRLADQYNGTQAEILCVSHGGTLLFGLPGLLSNVDFDFVRSHGLDHTEIISAEIRNGKLVCVEWGDIRLA